MSSRVLLTIDGKYPKVMYYEDGPRLCAVDSQTGGDTVNISYRKNWIAFTFSKTNDSVTTNYILQANGSSLELVPLNQVDQVDGFPAGSWFEKEGQSEHYKLKVPESNPQKYICIEEDTKGTFILSDNENIRASVRDKAN